MDDLVPAGEFVATPEGDRGPATVVICRDTMRSIQQFSDLSVALEQKGCATKQEWEHARSYAIEALTRLLRDNPELFDYGPRMDAISRERRAKP